MRRSEQPGSATEPAASAPVGVFSYDTDRTWTLPNMLSLLRIAGVALVLYLILGPHADGLAVLVLAVASFTDWLDGFLARRWHQTSRLGQMLDPIADRLYIFAVLIGLALRAIIPWWLVIILLGREVMIALLIPAAEDPWLHLAAGPLPRQGRAPSACCTRSRWSCGGPARHGALMAAWVLGWAFAIWGTGLYWYAGLLYLDQTLTLLRTTPRRPAAGRTGHVGT